MQRMRIAQNLIVYMYRGQQWLQYNFLCILGENTIEMENFNDRLFFSVFREKVKPNDIYGLVYFSPLFSPFVLFVSLFCLNGILINVCQICG